MKNANQRSQVSMLRRLLPSILCLELWKARNRARFDRLKPSHYQVIFAIIEWLRDILFLILLRWRC